MNLRVPLTVFFFMSALYFPWAVTLVAGTALAAVTEGYAVILGGLLVDLLYAGPVPSLGGFRFAGTATALVLVVGARLAKRHLSFSV